MLPTNSRTAGYERAFDAFFKSSCGRLTSFVARRYPNPRFNFGGVCKEYAVDRAAALARDLHAGSCLVNFGGDLAVSRPREGGLSWRVGLEAIAPGSGNVAGMIDVKQGGVATSGDTYRFVARDGRRFTHILNPRTGWPVVDAPRSVTVVAGSCTQAGMFTTLALLQGSGAQSFLERAGVLHWVVRE